MRNRETTSGTSREGDGQGNGQGQERRDIQTVTETER